MRGNSSIVIVIEAKHSPTEQEVRATIGAAMETGKQQGYEPLRAHAVSGDISVLVEDRIMIDKWERNS